MGLGRVPQLRLNLQTTEQRLVAALCLSAVLAVVFMGALVAPPKTLFGRSLTAISPSLFPLLVLSVLGALSAMYFAWRVRNPDPEPEEALPEHGLKRGALLFGLMTLYALLMEPIGFWLSSAISLALLSWLAGNRTLWQIAALSVVAPALLYLAATRLLAVSLPELNTIELFYARVLGL